MMTMRGIRGAITVDENSKDSIISATKELLIEIIAKNDIKTEDVASVIFTATQDLNAEFPAIAARQAGLTNAALMCSVEMDVPGSIKKCIRILMHVNSGNSQKSMKHVYMGGAAILRPDLK